MTIAAVKRMRQYLIENPNVNSYPDIIKISMQAMMEDIKERLDVFGSNGKCDSEESFCLSCDEENCGIFSNNELSRSSGSIYSELIKTISKDVSERIKKSINTP